MAACGVQVGNTTVLSKIEAFLNDTSYREAIENSANYNTRLCIERRLRMPFLDSQTGVAQNHSNLFMTPRQRIPGLVEGQIYTYPSKRWRKKRRQYLMNFMQPRRKELDPESDLHTISTVENPAASNEDSKDSVGLKDETAKDAWYYDELELQEMEGFDDPDPDSDYDYEESYTKRKGKKRTTKVARNTESPAAKKPKGPGRGRKKTNYDALTDAEKPFSCERGSTRRGRQGSSASQHAATSMPVTPVSVSQNSDDVPPSSITTPGMEKKPEVLVPIMPGSEEKERAAPSPYCDFCLGDAQENKKTGQSEELVSCSDCGRSGRAATQPSRGRGRGRKKASPIQ
ncbi:Zinc finger protein DPF3 [Blattella germanica]|nr:Zinc finger protein DPF3 [Blattella germanica]